MNAARLHARQQIDVRSWYMVQSVLFLFATTIPVSTEPAWLATAKDVIQVAVLVAGSLIGILQIRAHRKNRHMQSLLAVLGLLQDETVSQARWFAYEHHTEIDELLTSPIASEAERRRKLDQFIIANSKEGLNLDKYRHGIQTINLVAFLIRNGYVHSSVVPEYLAASIERMYIHFKGWIVYRRTIGRIPIGTPDSRPTSKQVRSRYCEHLEKLAGSIGPGYRVQINRLAPIRDFLNQLEQFGSTRVGRDVLDRIDDIEENVNEIRRSLRRATTDRDALT